MKALAGVVVAFGCAHAPASPTLTPFVHPPLRSWTSGSVFGVVIDPHGQPIEGATVTVAVRGESVSAFTNDRGGFVIEGLPRGEYVATFFYMEVASAKHVSVRLHERAYLIEVLDETKAATAHVEIPECTAWEPLPSQGHVDGGTLDCKMSCAQPEGRCADFCYSRGR